jgi:type I restriction enzyme M protein
MSDIVNTLWGFCHTLRHDGMDYGNYIEQLTYLLFLKMADEKEIAIPSYKITDEEGKTTEVSCDWDALKIKAGVELQEHYSNVLNTLKKQQGMLGDIFNGAMSRFNNPVNLKQVINMIDKEEWTAMEVDVKGAAFEGLLEKSAAEGKKGAGQFFTPRVLIQSICRVMKPDPRAKMDFKICDPA